MLLSRIFGRTLFAAAKSETSNATAAAASVARNPLQEFFEADRNIDDDKPVVYGMGRFLVPSFCLLIAFSSHNNLLFMALYYKIYSCFLFFILFFKLVITHAL